MHTLPIRVYYEDTDLAGVVYYANYLRFIERGRSEALRALGIDQLAMKADGLVFVVRRANIDYLSPARFDDLLEVRTTTSWVKRASAMMWQEVWRGDVRLLTAEITVACMSEKGRPAAFPTEVRAKLVEGTENTKSARGAE